jgi:hypothetical protein
VKYLGVIIREDSIAMDPIKVQGICNWKCPTTLKEVWAFLGFLNFYWMYIWEFSILAAPLNVLIAHCTWGGRFYWDKDYEKAFIALKNAVCSTSVL